MKRILVLIMFFAVSASLFAQPAKIKKEKKKKTVKTMDFGLQMEYGMSSHVFDFDGKDLSNLKIETNNDTTLVDSNYTMDLYQYRFVPYFSYMPNEQLKLTTSMSFSQNKLDEKYLYQSGYAVRNRKYSGSQFIAEYVSLAGEYTFLDMFIKSKAMGEVRVPFDPSESILSDTADYEILCGGAFEGLAGIGIVLPTRGLDITADVIYNYRDKELVDRMIYKLGFIFTSVPSAELRFGVDFGQKLEEFDRSIKFDPHRTPINEEFIDVNAGFNIFIDENFYTKFSYTVRVDGKNTWGYGLFRLSAGYQL